MAARKPTTTADLTGDATDLSPTRDDVLADIDLATSDEMRAEVDKVKTQKLKSPLGFVSEVPEGIVDALLESGYTKSK